jgi:glyoxylase-like metal-dependent hydrolase (beta-lactamase superfamily II)
MPFPELVPDQGPTLVADRVWVTRTSGPDVNVTLVAGERGLLVVDSLGSDEAADVLVEHVRRVSDQEVVAVVCTSGDHDHAGGTERLRREWPGLGVHAHEDTAPVVGALGGSVDHTFNSVQVVDLGDRVIELIHPGRGHTEGDVVVRIADAEVLVAGDLVASGTPAYGPLCFPLDWPSSLDFVVGLLTPGWVVVPGHGSLVDQEFANGQRGDVGTVAETIFDLASRMVPLEQALAHSVRRGYEQVPRTARRLPLV